MYSQRQSADRESSSSGTTMAQRATSVHGLDKSGASADDGKYKFTIIFIILKKFREIDIIF